MFGNFYSHVAKMPWTVLVAGNGHFVLRKADNKAVFECIVLQPSCIFRSCKTFLCCTFSISSSHIKREPGFLLTRDGSLLVMASSEQSFLQKSNLLRTFIMYSYIYNKKRPIGLFSFKKKSILLESKMLVNIFDFIDF
jgi:hypothetical protein